MTRRGALLLLAPLALVGAGAAVAQLTAAGITLMLVAALTVIVDSRRAPGLARISAERRHDDILSVGALNRVEVHISCRGRPAWAWLRDEVPTALHGSQTQWRLRIPGRVEYSVTPQARGVAEFGRVIVRAEGPWRLGWRQCAVDCRREVRIDADLSAVRVYEALARRGQLAELGLRTLRLRTEGTEFERIRDAVPDDPLRAINWRATARTGRLMATELIPERAQPLIICLDHGRLMGRSASSSIAQGSPTQPRPSLATRKRRPRSFTRCSSSSLPSRST